MELGTKWDRPHPGPFIWGWVEQTKGEYLWQYPDQWVQRNQSKGFGTLATIWPFAVWDQAQWELPTATTVLVFEQEMGKSRRKPHDIDAYKEFVSALVERYDGDGIDDMPGLELPIKYWEVSNEPGMQSGFNSFFNGSPEDYLEILKATYQAVKEADPDAKVLHAGMAGMESWIVSFWEPIFKNGSQYFDIANIHSIGASDELNVPQFSALLRKYNINKPIWVTEAQHRIGQSHSGKYISPEEHGQILVKSYVNAFACGVDKIFYTSFMAPPFDSPEFGQSALIESNGVKRPAFYAYKTLSQKLGGFTTAEKLAEGQYEFTVGGKILYVLWGTSSLPPEINGNVKITNIYGDEETTDAASLPLSDSPLFVEISNSDSISMPIYTPTPAPTTPTPTPYDISTMFTSSPVDIENIETIVVLGNLNPPSHTFPTDHIYLYISNPDHDNIPDKVPLYSPGNLPVTKINAYERVSENFTDYNITMEPTPYITIALGHVSSLSESIFGDVSFPSGWILQNEYSTGGETY
ncbi:MAG: hypothetical protein J7L90_00630, partial [Dehalococcoidia bacterium]|nr:hypothetical protein [Dehalococcoidia bacterium]